MVGGARDGGRSAISPMLEMEGARQSEEDESKERRSEEDIGGTRDRGQREGGLEGENRC